MLLKMKREANLVISTEMARKEYLRIWRARNRRRLLDYQKEWRTNNRAKMCEYSRAYRDRHGDKIRERDRKYKASLYGTRRDLILERNRIAWAKNREKYCARKRERYHKTKAGRREEIRSARLRFKYGISISDYNQMLTAQGEACAICKEPPRTRLLDVDHCHKTGRVRGLLCTRCNRGLSYLDNKEWLEAARRYINANPEN